MAVVPSLSLLVAAPSSAPTDYYALRSHTPCVLLLLRHLGCNCAPLTITDVLSTLQQGSRSDSIRVVAISSATDAPTAHGMSQELGLAANPNFVFLLDPKKEAYAALGLRRSIVATFIWRRWRNLVGFLSFGGQACCRRRIPFVNAGDAFQQGGVFVVGSGGTLLFEHRDTTPGWPLLDEAVFLTAVRAALAEERAELAAAEAAAGGGRPSRRAAPRRRSVGGATGSEI